MSDLEALVSSRGEGVVPYMGYIGMFHSKGYGFQALYSRIGYKESLYWSSENHPHCFLSNQKKVQILAFLHVIRQRNVSCHLPVRDIKG